MARNLNLDELQNCSAFQSYAETHSRPQSHSRPAGRIPFRDAQRDAHAPPDPDSLRNPFGLYVFTAGLPCLLLSMFLPPLGMIALAYVGCVLVIVGGTLWYLELTPPPDEAEWETEIDERAMRETFPAMQTKGRQN